MNKKLKNLPASERLIKEGWFDDENEVKVWIMLRNVLADDKPVTSPSQPIPPDAVIRVKEYYKKRYVNKGGLKLEGAMRAFGINACGAVALDCGASTGGFTDCLLQHGAVMVYAVDAGHGQLAGRLAIDARVVNMENTNLADPALTSLDPKPSMITLDLSYLSLTKAVPLCPDIACPAHDVICLVKPNFEAELVGADSGGVIRDRDTLRAILGALTGRFASAGYNVAAVINSPVTGSGGALEFFMLLSTRLPAADNIGSEIETAVNGALNVQKFSYNNINKEDLQ